MRAVAFLICAFMGALSAKAIAEDSTTATPREIAACGNNELSMFQTWSRIAGKSTDKSALSKVSNAQVFSVSMRDGRTIRGLRVYSTQSPAPSALLVIPGNAWLAQDFAKYAAWMAEQNIDVYIPDFRGYGLSAPAVPTMSAMVDDYREVGHWLVREHSYHATYLYAFSFGGVVALNAFADDDPFTRIVLDAVPSRPIELFKLTCDVQFDPVDHVPSDCHSVTVMHGTSDWVVNRPSAQELLDKLKACGATLDIDKPRGHPFQIELSSTRRSRLTDVLNHLRLQNGNADGR
jgi:dienelactone hydrolase